jgi:hypothetical protein
LLFFATPVFSAIYHLWGNGAQKGTPDAFPDIAQQLGNGAIVEKLRSGRSFFSVRTGGESSKGYAEKGAPAKILKSSQRPATIETRQSNRCLQLPGERAHDLAGRCFFLTSRIFPQAIHRIFQSAFSTHPAAIRRRILRKLAQFAISSVWIRV